MEENYNYDDNVKITGSSYEDEIINEGSEVTINARGGDDHIIDNGNFNSINGGDGNDVIELGEYVDSTTVTGGDGDDTIYFNGGNITVTDYEEGDTIALFGYTASELSSMITYEQGYYGDLSVYFGDEIGSIYFENVEDIHYITFLDSEGELVSILPKGLVCDAGTLYVYSDYEGYEIYLEELAETYGLEIANIDASNYEMEGLYIYQNNGYENYIYGSAVNDTIEVYAADGTTVSGGSGDDVIEVISSEEGATVSGGEGYDTFIFGSGYNLTITDYEEGDTIQLSYYGGSDYVNFEYNDYGLSIYIDEDSTINIVDGGSFENYGIPQINLVDSGGNAKLILPHSTEYSGETLYVYSGLDSEYAIELNNWNWLEDLYIKDVDASYFEEGSLSIYGNEDSNVITGASYGYTYIEGGDGDDTFVYVGGEMTIADYSEGDTIKIALEGITAEDMYIDDEGGIQIGEYGYIYLENIEDYENVTFVDVDGNIIDFPEPKPDDNIIIGTSGADTLTNSDSDYTIDALAGNDYIENYGDYVEIYAGDGNDSVYSESSYGTVDGGTGNDTIYIDGLSNIVNGGEGADHIIVYDGAKNTTINAGAGNDTVEGIGTLGSAVINLGAGNDSVKVFSNEVYATINADSGNNTIAMGGQKILINGGSDADSIHFYTSASSVTAYGGAGNDTLEVDGSRNIVDGGAGNDFFYLYVNASETSIYGGEGSDTIDGSGNYNLFDGGAGNDSIKVYYSDTNITARGGVGDDTIVTSGSQTSVNGDAGNDVILAFDVSADTTLRGGEGNDTIFSGGTDNLLDGGEGDDYLYIETNSDTESNGVTTMIGGAGNDSIENNGVNYTYINAGDGKDTIWNGGANTTIEAGAGDDSIYNGGSPVTINAGDGNDTIVNDSSYYNSINGGAGNDIISLTGTANDGYETVIGGTGNDTIYDVGKVKIVHQYANGDGNDVITGLKTNDTLHITSGSISSSVISGSDVILNIGSGSMTLKNVVGSSAYLKLGNGAVTTINFVDNKNVTLTSGSDNYTNTVAGANIYALAGNDNISNSAVSLQVYADAGNDTIQNTGHHSTIYGGAGKDSIINGNRGSALSLAGSYSFIDAGADDDYILNYDYSDYSFVNGGDGNDTIMSRASGSTIFGGAGNDSIRNVKGRVSIAGGDGNDSILDEGFVSGINNNNTIVGGKGNDGITLSSSGYNNIIQYANGDGNDVIYNLSTTDTIHITSGNVSSSVASGDDVILTVGTGTITLKGAAGQTVYLKIGTAAASVVTLPTGFNPTITGTAGIDSINNSDNDITFINALAGNDNISNSGEELTIDAGVGNDNISNSGSYVSISGGAGNDKITLTGTAQDVTVSGGAGNDTIYMNGQGNVIAYNAGEGKDVIDGFGGNGGVDSIKVTSGTITKCAQSGNNVLVTVGSAANVLTIKNITLSELSITSDLIVYVDNPYPKTLTTGADSESISDENATVYGIGGNDNITITGNTSYIDGGANNDKISIGGAAYGVTAVGGAGNDTIYTNGEGNLIVYNSGEGNDTIFGFSESDSIKVNGTINSTLLSGNNVLVKVGSSTITIKDTSKVKINGNIITPYYKRPETLSANGDSTVIAEDDSTIYAIGGNDNLTITGNNSYIDGGTGNDKISLDSAVAGVTMYGGVGNDTIYTNGEGNVIDYKTGDGKDTIVGFSGSDSIIVTGTISKSVQSGNNVIVTVGSASNLLTIKDVTTDDLVIDGGVITYYKPEPISLTTGNDRYLSSNDKATVYALNGNDTVTIAGSNSYVDGGIGNDKIYISDDAENTTVYGAAGNDTIYSDGNSNLFQYASGEGNDVIYDFGYDDLINYSGSLKSTTKSGNDMKFNFQSGSILIKNGADYDWAVENNTIHIKQRPTLVGSNSPDNILNDAEINAVAIFAYGGNDTITNKVAEVSIEAGAGNDVIINEGTNILINADAGNDKISLSGSDEESNVTVIGGVGNDTIYSDGNSNVFQYASGEGNDVIDGFGYSDSIKITSGVVKSSLRSGNDMKFNFQSGSILVKDGATEEWQIEDNIIHIKQRPTIFGTAQGETLINDETENAVAIVAYAGNDTVINKIDQVYIDAGAGNDVILNSGRDSTIYGAAGNDRITLDGSEEVTIIYNNGDGKDSIWGFSVGDVIQYSGAIKSSVETNGNTTFNIGSGSIFIQGVAKSKLFVDNDLIYMDMPTEVSLTATADKYTVAHDGDTVHALAGNDTLTVNAKEVYLDAGDGNDSIFINDFSENATINGGKGNDVVHFNDEGSIFLYANGDGKDTIYSFGLTDSIQVTSGTINKPTTVNGSDVQFKVGSGYIQIKNGAEYDWEIKGNIIHIDQPITLEGDDKANELINDEALGAVAILAYGGNDTVKNYVDEVYIDAGDGNDIITNSGSNVTIESGLGNDIITSSGSNVELYAGAGNDRITLSGTDENSRSTIDAGKGNDTIYSDGQYNLFTYTSGDGNDTIYNFSDYDSIEVADGSISTVGSGKDIRFKVGSGYIQIKDGAGRNWKYDNNIIRIDLPHTLTGSAGADTLINDEEENAVAIDALAGNDKIYNYIDDVTIYAGDGKDSIVNTGINASILGGAGDDKITLNSSEDESNVTVIGGAGNDTIYSDGHGNTFVYANGEGKDAIIDFSESDSIKVTSGTISPSKSGDDMKFKVGSGEILIKNGADYEWKYDGNIIRINAPHTLTGSDKADMLTNDENENAEAIDALAGNDSIVNTINDVTVSGGKGNDTITLTASDNITVLYEVGDGKDIIYGFGGNDSIQFSGGNISRSVKSSNGDIVITFNSSNSITLKDFDFKFSELIVDNDVILIDKAPEPEYGTDDPESFTTTSNKATIYAKGGNDTVSVTGSHSYIDGGAGNDKIYLEGDIENNTIYGGAGADTIYSNGNFNTILYDYGDGKDVIVDFGENDTIMGSGYIRRQKQTGSNLAVTIGSGNANVLTIRNVDEDDLTIDDDGDNFWIHFGTDSSADILDDDNFMSFEAQISDISEITSTNYSVTNLDAEQNYNNLAQSDAITRALTYSKEK